MFVRRELGGDCGGVEVFYHFEFRGKVDPELETTGIWLAGSVYGHFGVDDWGGQISIVPRSRTMSY